MEHGGNPNLSVNGEIIFERADFDLMFDIGEGYCFDESYHFQDTIQCWMVLVAYGGKLSNGTELIKMAAKFKPEIFKEFERFRWEIETHKPMPEQTDRWFIHFYDMASGKEVAVL